MRIRIKILFVGILVSPATITHHCLKMVVVDRTIIAVSVKNAYFSSLEKSLTIKLVEIPAIFYRTRFLRNSIIIHTLKAEKTGSQRK